MVQYHVENHGSIWLIRPVTQWANRWLRDHVDPEAQWFGGALVVEPRYAQPIIEGLQAAEAGRE